MTDPFWRSPYVEWLEDLPPEHALLVCTLRTARQAAKVAAVFEILALLREGQPHALLSGPGGEQKGVFWVALPQQRLVEAQALLPRLGYTAAVELAEPEAADAARSASVRWRGGKYRLTPLYREDAEALREQAPDRREFLLRTAEGEIVPVKGYRGDGTVFGKRGLPVYDARLLVNLAAAAPGAVLLDPFGGIGGVILAGREAGCRVVSLDSDPVVSVGLGALADLHCRGDARRLPFAEGSMGAIATEPPYDRDAANPLRESFPEMARVLKPGGRLAILCAGWQAEGLREAGERLALELVLDSPINRKGLEVQVLVWRKAGD